MRTFLVTAALIVAGLYQSPKDKTIGKATFEVLESGDFPIVRPVAGVTFGLQPVTKQGTQIPKGYAICEVIARQDEPNAQNVVYTTTILRCGEYEYGIRDVLFNGLQKEK